MRTTGVRTMAMYDETLELLKTRSIKLTYAEIERSTGLKESWLRMFGRGRILDPGVKRIETLNNFLKTEKV